MRAPVYHGVRDAQWVSANQGILANGDLYVISKGFTHALIACIRLSERSIEVLTREIDSGELGYCEEKARRLIESATKMVGEVNEMEALNLLVDEIRDIEARKRKIVELGGWWVSMTLGGIEMWERQADGKTHLADFETAWILESSAILRKAQVKRT